MIEIERYRSEKRDLWNKFNSESKNGLFMFDRNYMEYHSDRFLDHSLCFFQDNELVALLPANENSGKLVSHGGLTYGGFITSNKMKQHIMNDCFEALVSYCKENGINEIIYKQVPHIFHKQLAEEDTYSLFLNLAAIVKIEASTVINLTNPLKMPKGRKAQISRAKREGVTIVELDELDDFERFVDLENEVLAEHNVTAVHSGEELKLLQSRFSENIHLICAIYNGSIISGTVIFEYDDVIHTQYMASNEIGREFGGLDLTISYVIERYKSTKRWLDFGISTENNGMFLNHGLISQKEGFGGRTMVYKTWKMTL